MWSAATVFVCALELLGRTEANFPPVEFIENVPPGVSPLASGYVLWPEKRLVIITSTVAFMQARRARDRCNNIEATREIAGVLVHEEWHLTHGTDEAGAYDAQMIALLAAGATTDSRLFHKVKKAKLAVLAAAQQTTRGGVMARPVSSAKTRYGGFLVMRPNMPPHPYQHPVIGAHRRRAGACVSPCLPRASAPRVCICDGSPDTRRGLDRRLSTGR